MNPYDSAGSGSSDPFEQSLTQHQQRIDALRAVKTQQEVLRMTREREARAVANAEAALRELEAKAVNLGAYDLIPEALRPKPAAARAAQS